MKLATDVEVPVLHSSGEEHGKMISGGARLWGIALPRATLVDLFEAEEGTICQYYGRIGQGKTYSATADILDDLRHGVVVYANWKLNFDGFDERKSFVHLFLGFLGLKRNYYVFPKENLRYIEIDDNFLDTFEHLTDCKVYLDEGHVAFDSYEMAKMSLRKRKAVLHTRHFNRTICIISQRPTAVHVSMRANVNIFYKCEKLLSWPILLFRRTEFQDFVAGETVDETRPSGRKTYIANKKVLNAYNSKYLRGGIPRSQDVSFEAYKVSWFARFRLLLRIAVLALRPKLRERPILSLNKAEDFELKGLDKQLTIGKDTNIIN